MHFRPKMMIGVLGLALVAMTQSRAQADPPAPTVVPWVFELGDINGDGASDFAMAIPYEVDANSPSKITLYSGANNAILSTMPPRVNETGFGIAVVPVNDVDHDGVRDVVVTALDASEPENPGRSLIFSSATGSLLAMLRMRVGVGGQVSDNPTEVTPLLTGDLNGNRQIDGGDVETIARGF